MSFQYLSHVVLSYQRIPINFVPWNVKGPIYKVTYCTCGSSYLSRRQNILYTYSFFITFSFCKLIIGKIEVNYSIVFNIRGFGVWQTSVESLFSSLLALAKKFEPFITLIFSSIKCMTHHLKRTVIFKWHNI